ncbi:MAG TPA: sigma 54-interacting transcriptional regulator [Terriglobales bacterium]|nr:sigma 54-interacting transcriptional regulator [Terriglobales bacterium]
MNPRLLAIAGPLKDSTFALPTGEIHVGRDPSNLLSISDPSLSRRHCALSRDGDGYKIRDLDSRNGTSVNGVAVKESRLRHGDQISVGDSIFLLLLHEDEEDSTAGRVEYEDSLTQATAQLSPQDVLYLQPDRILKELPASSRVARNLNALLKVSRVVHSIRDLDELQGQILNLIFEVVPAERAAILLDGKGDEHFSSVFSRHRVAKSPLPVRISRTIARQVMQEGLAVLGADVPGSNDLADVESLIHGQVRSLLCVPLTMFQKVTGCIYLDTCDSASRFDEDHLQLVAAIAGTSAVALENARRMQWLEQENLRLTAEVSLDHNLIGESSRMKEVYQFLARVAPTESNVLLQGESGTGKELAARAIHRNSPRSSKPFLALNCAAIPEGLLESELFGHERGAFTGAVAQKKGRLEMADGGVVFLDEIGELAPALQVKLLRVLQEREFERVGGMRAISVDIRLIAATNRDLGEAVKTGAFRKDLFYRLNVLSLVMPPLRERREDIAMLADYFVSKYIKKFNLRARRLSPEAITCLVNYDWPGNVRELENAIERALVLSVSDVIPPEDLPESILEKGLTPAIEGTNYHRQVRELKKQLILNALEETKGNYTEAARTLDIHVNYLHRLIRNLDLKDALRSLPSLRPGTESTRRRESRQLET